MSVSTYLMKELQGYEEYNIEEGVEETGIIDVNTDSISDPTIYQTFLLLFFDIYLLLLAEIEKKLDYIIETSFLSSNVMILESSKTISDPSKSIDELVSILKSILNSLHNSNLFPILVKQILNQLVYYVIAKLFNLMATTDSLCTPKTALRVKMGLSLFETWLIELNQEYKDQFPDIEYFILTLFPFFFLSFIHLFPPFPTN